MLPNGQSTMHCINTTKPYWVMHWILIYANLNLISYKYYWMCMHYLKLVGFHVPVQKSASVNCFVTLPSSMTAQAWCRFFISSVHEISFTDNFINICTCLTGINYNCKFSPLSLWLEHWNLTLNFVNFCLLQGGNDYEIYMDDRTRGHIVTSPEDTMNQLKEIFCMSWKLQI